MTDSNRSVKYRVNIADAVIIDIAEMSYYYETVLNNPIAAKSLKDRINKAILSLQELPQRNPSLDTLLGFRTGYRYLISASQYLIYRIDDNMETVYVIRMVDGRTNYMRALTDTIYQAGEYLHE